VTPELLRWVEGWRAAGPALERLKWAELEQLETMKALDQLADAFDHAVRHAPRTTTSGLVEQQRVFALLRP
jgi:hypothetical protein